MVKQSYVHTAKLGSESACADMERSLTDTVSGEDEHRGAEPCIKSPSFCVKEERRRIQFIFARLCIKKRWKIYKNLIKL